jgi:hypothetical protein
MLIRIEAKIDQDPANRTIFRLRLDEGLYHWLEALEGNR